MRYGTVNALDCSVSDNLGYWVVWKKACINLRILSLIHIYYITIYVKYIHTHTHTHNGVDLAVFYFRCLKL